jgi:hypothetical protein
MNKLNIQKLLEKYKAPFTVSVYEIGHVIDKYDYDIVDENGYCICQFSDKEKAEFICAALNVFHYSTTYALGIRGN